MTNFDVNTNPELGQQPQETVTPQGRKQGDNDRGKTKDVSKTKELIQLSAVLKDLPEEQHEYAYDQFIELLNKKKIRAVPLKNKITIKGEEHNDEYIMVTSEFNKWRSNISINYMLEKVISDDSVAFSLEEAAEHFDTIANKRALRMTPTRNGSKNSKK